jgi:tetratricopeptide (TPR) repeat protein
MIPLPPSLPKGSFGATSPPSLPKEGFGATGRWCVVAVLAMVLGVPRPVDTAGQDAVPRLPADYLTALASYRAGDLAAAFGQLQQVGESQVMDITKRLMRPDVAAGANWPRLLMAAILLHTEAFLIRAEAETGGPAASDGYLASARLLVRRLLQLAEDGQPGIGEKERRFARDWYLLLVAVQHGRAEVGWSRAYLEEALKSFPKDPYLRVALGSNHEMLSDLSVGYVNYVDASGRYLRQGSVDAAHELRDAIRCLEEAVVLAPQLFEARLRLGRLLYRRGELDRAAKELETARQLAPQVELKYLALLFSGMVEAARGSYDRADRFYTDALQLLPAGQTAAIAKAETAYLRGRVSEAAATVQAVLQQTKKEDPWWGYMSGESWHLEHRLEWLRQYVQQ